MNVPEAPDISPSPGFFQSIFIFLAGGDPASFRKLPRAEASEFAKLGVVVLIPALLAVTAGTFTVQTYRDDQSLTAPLIFGLIWCGVILTLDIIVMSQMTKGAPLPKRVSSEPKSNLGAQRRPERTIIERSQHSQGGGRFAAILIRLVFSIVLGAVMSHCLLLAFFGTRIKQQLDATRLIRQADLKASFPSLDFEEQRLQEASRIRAQTDDALLLQEFRVFNKEAPGAVSSSTRQPLPAPNSAVATSPKQSLSDAEKRFEDSKASIMDSVKQREDEAKKMNADYLEREKHLEELKRDMGKANNKLQTEMGGERTEDFRFETLEFAALGNTTSGIVGAGFRTKHIKAFIDTWKAKIEDEVDAVKILHANLIKNQAAVAQARETALKQIDEERSKMLAGKTAEELAAADKIRKANEKLSATAETAKSRLDEEIRTLTETITNAKKDREEKLAALRGKRSDIGEKTDAFHDLIFGVNLEGNSGKGRLSFVITAAAFWFGLMLIDLSPLVFKSLRQPGPYERLRQMQMDYDPWAAAQQAATEETEGPSMDYYASGPKPPRKVPGPRRSGPNPRQN